MGTGGGGGQGQGGGRVMDTGIARLRVRTCTRVAACPSACRDRPPHRHDLRLPSPPPALQMVEAVEKLRSEFESMKIKAQHAVDEKQRSVDLLKLQLQHQRLLGHGPPEHLSPHSEVELEGLRLQTTLIKVQGESAGCTEKLALAELTGGMGKDEKAKLTAKLQVCARVCGPVRAASPAMVSTRSVPRCTVTYAEGVGGGGIALGAQCPARRGSDRPPNMRTSPAVHRGNTCSANRTVRWRTDGHGPQWPVLA